MAPKEPQFDSGNRRHDRRNRVLLGGLVVSRDGAQTWDCTVTDLSETGAKIRLAKDQVIPEHHILINLKEGVAYEATASWIRLPLVGLNFSAEHRLEDLTDNKLMFVRRLWQERRRR
jgi:PilZ domain